jgi:hypothetical protein
MIRPGRVDFKQFIGYASEYQMLNMFFTIPIEVGLKYIKETNSQNDIEEGKQLTGIQKFINDQKTYEDDKQ